MDIFEQLENAHIMLMNGIPTHNYGWNPDDPDEDWCLSVYVDYENDHYEYYFTKDDLENAEPYGEGFIIRNEKYDDLIEFLAMVPIAQYNKVASK